jgi:hypothetical protein
MMKLYLQNGRKLKRKFIVEDNYQSEIEEEVSKKMNLSHVAEELESHKKLARTLEEKLEIDILYHQKEIMEYEKGKRLALILTATTERHMQNWKEHNAQWR